MTAELNTKRLQHLREAVPGGTAVGVPYGPDIPANFRRAAAYVDKILRGVRPADLPVEQPISFHLAVNLSTAKALGLTIPPSVLVRADEPFEIAFTLAAIVAVPAVFLYAIAAAQRKHRR